MFGLEYGLTFAAVAASMPSSYTRAQTIPAAAVAFVVGVAISYYGIERPRKDKGAPLGSIIVIAQCAFALLIAGWWFSAEPLDSRVWVWYFGLSLVCVGRWYVDTNLQSLSALWEERKAALHPEISISNIDWPTVASLLRRESPQTEIQRDESWKQIQGKKIKWTGKVHSVSGEYVVKVDVQMDPRSSPWWDSDVWLWLPDSERDRALLLSEGDSITFTGILGENYSNCLDRAEIVSWQSPLQEFGNPATGNGNQPEHTAPL